MADDIEKIKCGLNRVKKFISELGGLTSDDLAMLMQALSSLKGVSMGQNSDSNLGMNQTVNMGNTQDNEEEAEKG